MTFSQVGNLLALGALPLLLTGTINRVKSLWSGRKGPPLLQPAYDVIRLLRKSPVYSTTTTPVFRIAPYAFLLTTLASAMVTPLLGASPITAFPFDFVWFAYVGALGRVAVMLAALDTGSAFEGMGAAREATFSTLIEPALFLALGASSLLSGTSTLHQALEADLPAGAGTVAWVGSVVALFIVLQAETARMPVDDPATHLELTMVHEVMGLDHSGPELAAIQVGSAIKLLVGSSIVATLMNPWAGSPGAAAAVVNVTLCGVIAVIIGTTESLIARLKLRAVPQYLAVALAAGVVALLATMWGVGAEP
jgi:formate hydrogenlyase subunit 4